MQKQLAKRITFVAILVLTPILAASLRTSGQEDSSQTKEKWEYLVVSNANRTNFSPTGNPRMRKEEQGSFGIEAFVLEQQLDKLGRNGWELVAVAGPPTDPIYYFKRSK